MINRSYIHALSEALFVTQKLRYCVPVRPFDIKNGLTVRIVKNRGGKLFDYCGSYFIGNNRRGGRGRIGDFVISHGYELVIVTGRTEPVTPSMLSI